MLEDKEQYETENIKYDADLDEEDYKSLEEEIKEIIKSGENSASVLGFIASVTLLITIIAVIICFIKFNWLVGFSILFLGIVLALIISAISKVLGIITINTIKTIAIEKVLEELVENDIINLVVNPNVLMPNRETRRKKSKTQTKR